MVTFGELKETLLIFCGYDTDKSIYPDYPQELETVGIMLKDGEDYYNLKVRCVEDYTIYLKCLCLEFEPKIDSIMTFGALMQSLIDEHMNETYKPYLFDCANILLDIGGDLHELEYDKIEIGVETWTWFDLPHVPFLILKLRKTTPHTKAYIDDFGLWFK